MPFSQPMKSTYCQHDLSPTMFTLVTWPRSCLPGFSTVNVVSTFLGSSHEVQLTLSRKWGGESKYILKCIIVLNCKVILSLILSLDTKSMFSGIIFWEENSNSMQIFLSFQPRHFCLLYWFIEYVPHGNHSSGHSSLKKNCWPFKVILEHIL